MVGSYSLLDAISVAMEPWTIEHRIFVFEKFIQTGSSVVLTQRRFRIHFKFVTMAPFRLEIQY
jgi:hypothetical protein